MGLFIAGLEEAINLGCASLIAECIESAPRDVLDVIASRRLSFDTESYRLREELNNEEAVKKAYGDRLEEFFNRMHSRDEMPVHTCS